MVIQYFYLFFSCSVVSASLQAHGLQPTSLLCPWDFSGKNNGVGGYPFPPPGDLPDPGIEPTPPALADRSLTLHYLGSSEVIVANIFLENSVCEGAEMV